ncbi:MAG: PEP-CTERM sorting domain-containing protein [Desulfobacula sp.]|uniref:PEP-CTERM sorting domain-containing protein n=1 Tax=Desulfobacula sp. TaxID=2593537 RepID=UPI0025C68081|nr:PEP-CTERM sorting domain-containing protein [Desulfobacula sp.]MCD4722949.1 PEP-CTERM sorting domain-containing protein [Desulfobacula sp.]
MNLKFKIFLLCVLLLSFTISANATSLITNGGFENGSGQLPLGWPSSAGTWGGDAAYFSSSPNQGITAQEGSQMLKFEFAGSAPSSTWTASDIYQLIDMNAYLGLIGSGNALVTASGFFNRIDYDAQTDTGFDLSIYAMDGTSIPGSWIGSERAFLTSDTVLDTWEKLTVSYLLPKETTWLAVHIAAHENIFNDGANAVEFDGHYADNITLTIAPVPEPATMLLFGLGLLGLAGVSRKK